MQMNNEFQYFIEIEKYKRSPTLPWWNPAPRWEREPTGPFCSLLIQSLFNLIDRLFSSPFSINYFKYFFSNSINQLIRKLSKNLTNKFLNISENQKYYG